MFLEEPQLRTATLCVHLHVYTLMCVYEPFYDNVTDARCVCMGKRTVAQDPGCSLDDDTVVKMSCRYTFDTLNVGDQFESEHVNVGGRGNIKVRLHHERAGEM